LGLLAGEKKKKSGFRVYSAFQNSLDFTSSPPLSSRPLLKQAVAETEVVEAVKVTVTWTDNHNTADGSASQSLRASEPESLRALEPESLRA